LGVAPQKFPGVFSNDKMTPGTPANEIVEAAAGRGRPKFREHFSPPGTRPASRTLEVSLLEVFAYFPSGEMMSLS